MANYLNKQETNDSKVQAILNMVNIVPNFIQQWQAIDSQYKEQFGFGDELTDAERIKEYRLINENYKKYIRTKRKEIIENIDKPIQIIERVNRWLDIEPQAPTDGWSRWFIVYTKMSKEWLLVLRDFAKQLEELNNKEE